MASLYIYIVFAQLFSLLTCSREKVKEDIFTGTIFEGRHGGA